MRTFTAVSLAVFLAIALAATPAHHPNNSTVPADPILRPVEAPDRGAELAGEHRRITPRGARVTSRFAASFEVEKQELVAQDSTKCPALTGALLPDPNDAIRPRQDHGPLPAPNDGSNGDNCVLVNGCYVCTPPA